MDEFWKKKKLEFFNEAEWEAVCLQCGKCCLCKLAKDDKVLFLNYVCDGYNLVTGKCNRYERRLCKECVKIDMRLLKKEIELLPETCAYRLLYEGKDLPDYHPLVSGNSNSVHLAGQTLVEMKNIYSATKMEREIRLLHLKAIAFGWDDSELFLEESKLFQKYESERLFEYSVPQKSG